MLKHSLEDQLILHEGLRLEVYKCPADSGLSELWANLRQSPLRSDEQEYILGCRA